MIKLFSMGILALALLCAPANAGLVLLDEFSQAQVANSAVVLNSETGLFAGLNTTRSVSSAGLTTLRVNAGSLNFASIGAGTSTLTYTFSVGIPASSLTNPANQNWLASFAIDDYVPGPIDTQIVVNGVSLTPAQFGTIASVGVSSLNFIDGLGTTLNSLSFVFTSPAIGGSFAANSLSATPEPASMLTAGLFVLGGAGFYRRRNKSIVK